MKLDEKRQEPSGREAGARNRRARSAGPASRGKTPAKRSNGHPRVNGHDRASRPNPVLTAPDEQGSAASDDANGASAASAAISSAAGADRKACAEVALPRPHGAVSESARGKSHGANNGDKIPPGEGPLPLNPGEFVEEIHRRIDLFQVWQGLLKSKDKKIKQRAVERLTDLRYKGAAALAEEPQEIIFDMPRPKRD
jgi:hypothetical protein